MQLLVPLLMSSLLTSGPLTEPPRKKHPVRLEVPPNALQPVQSGGGTVVAKSPIPVSSLKRGHAFVRTRLPGKVVAMREVKGYFFYATVAPGDDRGATFISGYAIKRNGRDVVEISVW